MTDGIEITESGSRQAVRKWVEDQRAALEAAQASGSLARTKLDLKDSFEEAFAGAPNGSTPKSVLFDQELEALCSDMRLAAVTVQQQVERVATSGPRPLLAFFAGIIASAVTLVIMTQVTTSPLVGFGLPVVVFFWVFVVVYRPRPVKTDPAVAEMY